MKKLIIGFIVLILLTPIGLLAPGVAWGEWGLDEIKQKLGFIPQGMSRLNEIIKNILPDYGIPGFAKNFFQSALGYILAAVVGIIAITLIFWLIAQFVPEKKEKIP
jgi:hypothetical protein